MSAAQAHFHVQQKVLFRHCDPAGIAFYPRLFEMVNDAIEQMFSDLIGWPWEDMHQTHGGPTVALEAGFAGKCWHGDVLDLGITIHKIGTSSLQLETRAIGHDGELRFWVKNTMVCIDMQGSAVAWPAQVIEKLENVTKVTR